MRKDDLKVIRFATIVCVACSFLLALTASALRPRQDANRTFFQKQNVLAAFQVETVDKSGRPWTREQTLAFFDERIQVKILDADTGTVREGMTLEDADPEAIRAGSLRPLYILTEDGEPVSYAFPISGQGLWSTLYGFMALEKDLATIRGVSFYEHGETPGLGGEVDSDWFTAQFRGKRVFADGELVEFEVVKGGGTEDRDHAVDGITAATITSRGVQNFLNRDLRAYEPFFRTIRGG